MQYANHVKTSEIVWKKQDARPMGVTCQSWNTKHGPTRWAKNVHTTHNILFSKNRSNNMDIPRTTTCDAFDITWPVSRTRMPSFDAHMLGESLHMHIRGGREVLHAGAAGTHQITACRGVSEGSSTEGSGSRRLVRWDPPKQVCRMTDIRWDQESMSLMSAHIQGHGQGFLAVYLLIATDESARVKWRHFHESFIFCVSSDS